MDSVSTSSDFLSAGLFGDGSDSGVGEPAAVSSFGGTEGLALAVFAWAMGLMALEKPESRSLEELAMLSRYLSVTLLSLRPVTTGSATVSGDKTSMVGVGGGAATTSVFEKEANSDDG